MKFFSVKVVDDDEIKDIDDSIEFFIIAALGFAFTENILYFYNIWASQPDKLLLCFLYIILKLVCKKPWRTLTT